MNQYDPDHYRFRRQLDEVQNVIDGPYGKVDGWVVKLACLAFLAFMFIVGLKYESLLWAWLMMGDWWRAL